MAVHQESLEMMKPVEHLEEAPEIEYRTVRADSLTMFGAAIGGAILGMLLTLLVLAIINGGTLSFTGGERLTVVEANLARVNENVGAVSANIDTVATQLQTLGGQLDEVRADLSAKGQEIAGINEAIDTLDVTRQQFDTFMEALSTALTSVSELNSAGAGE